MRRKTVFLFFLIASMMASCLPDPLDVKNIPVLQSRIVVSTQIVPNQSIAVFLTRSVGALDAGNNSDVQSLITQIVINDATVTIHYDNKMDTLTNFGDGLYGGVSTPIITGKSYTLEISSASLGKVTSTTQALRPIPFKDVAATLDKGQYDSLVQVEYSLEDPEEKNFYMINIQKFSQKQDLNSLLNPRVFTHVLNDESFNGTTFEETFRAFFQHYSEGDTVAVSLTNISEDYYKYVKVRVDNRFSVASFATEPFNYPTNVKGGYGFFTTQQPDVHFFVLE